MRRAITLHTNAVDLGIDRGSEVVMVELVVWIWIVVIAVEKFAYL